jgi:hypothetical protein
MAAPKSSLRFLLLRTRADVSLNRVVRSGYYEGSTNMPLQVDLKLSAATMGAKFPVNSVLTVDSVSAETCSGNFHVYQRHCFRSPQEVRLDSICACLTSNPMAYSDTERCTPSMLTSVGSCCRCARHSPG